MKKLFFAVDLKKIDIKAGEMPVFLVQIKEDLIDERRFAESARCEQNDIVVILDFLDNAGAFIFAVKKVFPGNNFANHKGIFGEFYSRHSAFF